MVAFCAATTGATEVIRSAERFEGKRVIVTGGGRGIGRSIARRFAEESAEVMLVGRSARALEQARADLETVGGTAWTYPADLQNPAAVRRVLDAVDARWDRVDVLVNNAALDDRASFLEITEEGWDRVLAVNLKAPFLLSQGIGRRMAETGGGALVHLASIDALGADGPYASYAAAKAALLALSRCMAVELARYGIRSNVVSPGFTMTEMIRDVVGPSVVEHLDGGFDRSPMRRAARPGEVAAAVVFLASDDAAAITGANLVVDTGITANLYVLETLPDQGPD